MLVVDTLFLASHFAYAEATKDGTDMFGPVERATRADVLAQLKDPNERASQKALEDPRGRQPDGQDAVGRAAGARGPSAPAGAQAGRPAEDHPAQGAGPDQQGLKLESHSAADLQGRADRGPPPPRSSGRIRSLWPEVQRALYARHASICRCMGVS